MAICARGHHVCWIQDLHEKTVCLECHDLDVATAERARIIARIREEADKHKRTANGASIMGDHPAYDEEVATSAALGRLADLLESEGKP